MNKIKHSLYDLILELTTPHQRASAKLLNLSGLASFSARYMRNEEKISAKNPIYTVVNSSCAWCVDRVRIRYRMMSL